MGGPETRRISIYGADRVGILMVQCTLNGTRCAVSLITLIVYCVLKASALRQWWAALPITAMGG